MFLQIFAKSARPLQGAVEQVSRDMRIDVMGRRSLTFWITAQFLLWVAPIGANAQATNKAPIAPGATSEGVAPYVLGTGDKLSVWALGAEELSDKAVTVGDDGYVDLPLVGRLQAGGLTPDQLRSTISTALLPYVKRPRVTVSVVEVKSQPVSVMGAVNRPGVYQVQGKKTLAEVLSLAEGARQDAGNTIRISRRPDQPRLKLSNSALQPDGASMAEVRVKDLLDGRLENVLVAPHDVITVSKSPIVYVIGEVRKPGGFAVGERDSLTVLQALSMAEGITKTAIAGKSRLLRLNPGSSTRDEVPLDVKRILSGKNPDVPMQPDDILFIPDSKIKTGLAKVVETAVSTVSGVIIYRAAYPR